MKSLLPHSHPKDFQLSAGRTGDGRNPAPVDMVNIHIIYKVVYVPGGFFAGYLNHQQYPHRIEVHTKWGWARHPPPQ